MMSNIHKWTNLMLTLKARLFDAKNLAQKALKFIILRVQTVHRVPSMTYYLNFYRVNLNLSSIIDCQFLNVAIKNLCVEITAHNIANYRPMHIKTIHTQ